jgi:hypothetical protein
LAEKFLGNPQIAHVNKDDEIRDIAGIFVAQVIAENTMIAFAGKSNDIERFSINLDLAPVQLPEPVDGVLLDDRES